MFIEFIESAAETLPDVETGEFVDGATCRYRQPHVAANRDQGVV
jgi:hypothetical protein